MDCRLVTPLDTERVFNVIGELHQSELGAGLLAELGQAFLIDFYRFASGKACLVAAVENREVIGFILVTSDRAAFHRAYMMSRGVWIAGTLLLCGPRALKRAISLRAHMVSDHNLSKAELLSIAVHPDHRRRGVAKALVRYCARFTPTFQVTASHTQPEALKFYESLSGKLERETDIGGLKSFTFSVSVPP